MSEQEVAFSTAPMPDSEPVRHRILARYPCHGRPIVRLLERPSFQCWMAMVHDFSAHGLGLVFHRALDAGTVLALQLRQRHHGLSRILSVRVVHSTPQPDGNYLIGCELNSVLTEGELTALRWPVPQ
jgi:hypothetical protein